MSGHIIIMIRTEVKNSCTNVLVWFLPSSLSLSVSSPLQRLIFVCTCVFVSLHAFFAVLHVNIGMCKCSSR